MPALAPQPQQQQLSLRQRVGALMRTVTSDSRPGLRHSAAKRLETSAMLHSLHCRSKYSRKKTW